MPKKPAKNGFFYFMLDFKRRHEYRGRTFHNGMQEVAALASEHWNNLPQHRKDYFNHIAKEKKNDPRPNVPKKDERRFNSDGISYAEIKMRRSQFENKIKLEKDHIAKFVNNLTIDDLTEKMFYLVHVNIFCKTDCETYYPAEIGLVKFNMKDGVKNVFHRYIDPGPIAPGYSFTVKEHSDKTHRLTLPFVRSVEGSGDLARLYHEICSFLKDDEFGSTDGENPPLFTMEEDIFYNLSIDAVKQTLKILWQHAHPSHNPDDDRWKSVFNVFSLPEMFCHLKNKCVAVTHPNTIAFPNSVLAKSELLKETYSYELNAACRFHRDEDIISFCSRSFVLRWVYIIRDHCADPIGIDLFANYNAPKIEVKSEHNGYFDDNASVANSQYSGSDSTNLWSIKPETTSVKDEKVDFDHSSSFLKRERDDDKDAVALRIKREKTDNNYIENKEACPVKLEKDLTTTSVKQEKGVDSIKQEYKVDLIKQEKYVDDCSMNSTVKRENDGKLIDHAAHWVKNEVNTIKEEPKFGGNSSTNSIKTEKDADYPVTNFIKVEKIDCEEDEKQANQIDGW